MAKKYINWKTKGMNRDMSVSAFNPEFAFENHNLRLATNEGNTMMSWVNERGPKELKLLIDTEPWSQVDSEGKYTNEIEGTTIGTAVLNHKLVIFTTGAYDCIYVFEESENTEYDLKGKVLYNGLLGFSAEYPIETLVSYESENIQKVYWTDNKNQPRIINIAASMDSKTNLYNDHSFDFVQELQLNETVKVTKVFGSGEFPPGVIQYAFTYYNKYGQESNIFHVTPLQYISYVDRGGSPESKIANSFRITMSDVDENFEYLRIYSILRTSKDAVPSVRRVQDIEIKNDVLSFIDDGLHGDTVDPTELLYKGGEEIKAKTMEQKDDTLFLGNIAIIRPSLDIKDTILAANEVTKANPLANDNIVATYSIRPFSIASKEPFLYVNTLSCPESNDYQGASGFKAREYYRLGVQFQYKNGKWSEPCWIGDKQQTVYPRIDTIDETNGVHNFCIPEFKYTLNKGEVGSIFTKLWKAGYRRIRPVFVEPKASDRTILCQGVGCPTMYRKASRYSDEENTNEGTLYSQSSWLFRTPVSMEENGDASNGGGKITYNGKLNSQFDQPLIVDRGTTAASDNYLKVMSPWLRCTEVMGKYDDRHAFYVDDLFATIHSPEFLFDDSFSNMDFKGCSMDWVGGVQLSKTYGDIDIQVSSPAIGSDAAGFVHKSIVTDPSAALISAPFFNDYLVNSPDGSKYEAYHTSSPPIDYPVYMWHKNGSLNNDVQRSNRSAELLKKKISNYRFGSDTNYIGSEKCKKYDVDDMQLFNNDTLSMVKVAGHIYMGNIETMLTPTIPSPHFLIGNPWRDTVDTDFNSDSYYFLALNDPNNTDSRSGVWAWEKQNGTWGWYSNKERTEIGNKVKGLVQWREPVSMKYKSTSHLAVKLTSADNEFGGMLHSNGIFKAVKGKADDNTMPMVEIVKPYNKETIFGGTSDEALQTATWIPCGPIVSFTEDTESVDINFKWGDTYFQRYECLKTYAFTSEDKNQVVEIASFMLETRVNIDGRYDRNRAQTSNLNMSPQNFNLLNPVYSQLDNFFSYKMLDEEDYKNTTYPNNVTWTKTKQNGADIDLWTNITMANTLELDGDKGGINKLVRMNNQLLAFQDSGISQILYNENTQISTTEGVPIEIANSQKVQGKRYYTDTVGCSNKWSIAQTPAGIYFMDSNEKSIYLFNGQLNNLSTAGGFNSWAKQNIPSANVDWTPTSFSSFVAYYDKLNQDVLFINGETSLAYSEKFNCFTSFYDYGGAPYFTNLDDKEIWVKDSKLWQHQAGKYCNFFGVNKPFSMTLIANQEPQIDKIFTNLEFRACVDGEGTYNSVKDKFTPSLPFETLETWNEYQHGILTLSNRNANDRFTHGKDNGILARKFRMWRCDIPRDNAKVDNATESLMGIKRFKARPLDRIRNPWAYLKLKKNAAKEGSIISRVEIHDIMVTYFG